MNPLSQLSTLTKYRAAAYVTVFLLGSLLVLDLQHPLVFTAWGLSLLLWAMVLPGCVTQEGEPPSAQPFPLWGFLAVTVAAVVTRLWNIQEIPQGAYLDEVLTMRNTLGLFHSSFDPFGFTPLFVDGWVETSHLYLMFNALIVRIFGVSYTSIKLFSVIPGVLTCGFFSLCCFRLFPRKLALITSFLLVFSHWHIRLSRYGWDVSFLLMCVALSLLLVLMSRKKGDRFLYLAGVVCGISLYSYIASRVSTLSFVVFLMLELILYRDRVHLRRVLSFSLGAVVTSLPLWMYTFLNTAVASVRVKELSLLGQDNPMGTLWENLLGHAMMFHLKGGVYARDNFPGLPMLDVVTGMFLLIGLIVLLRKIREPIPRLILVLFACNFIPGILSVSQEGPPYVYRVAVVLLPTVLIAGYGVGWASNALRTLRFMSKASGGRAWAGGVAVLVPVIMLNLHAYFGKEAVSRSAMRQMAIEKRIVGWELSQLEGPVFLLMPNVLRKLPNQPLEGERYYAQNRNMFWGTDLAFRALLYYSGRYDAALSFEQNFQQADIYFIFSGQEAQEIKLPSTVLFLEEDKDWFRSLQASNPELTLEFSTLRQGQKLGLQKAQLSVKSEPMP